MYIPPKGFFTRVFEAAVLFALAAWLVRTGICMLQDVWVWIIVIAALVLLGRAGWKLYKHYKETHGF